MWLRPELLTSLKVISSSVTPAAFSSFIPFHKLCSKPGNPPTCYISAVFGVGHCNCVERLAGELVQQASSLRTLHLWHSGEAFTGVLPHPHWYVKGPRKYPGKRANDQLVMQNIWKMFGQIASPSNPFS